MPELLWKAYIDFEIGEGERELARALYDRLVEPSGHVKVWIAYAQFEAEPIPVLRAIQEEGEGDGEKVVDLEPRYVPGDSAIARQVFKRGHEDLKRQGLKREVTPIAAF
jgi:crooked neck